MLSLGKVAEAGAVVGVWCVCVGGVLVAYISHLLLAHANVILNHLLYSFECV